MIEFGCAICGNQITVSTSAAGKKGNCTGCGTQIIVPGESQLLTPSEILTIEFGCAICGNQIRVPQWAASKRGSCTGCGAQIVIPDGPTVLAQSKTDRDLRSLFRCTTCGVSDVQMVGQRLWCNICADWANKRKTPETRVDRGLVLKQQLSKAILFPRSAGTKRPQNHCLSCRGTWYPRGADVSTICPKCGSHSVGVR